MTFKCWCGCGEEVNNYYKRGHDQRHLQDMVRNYSGSVDDLDRYFPTYAMIDRYLNEIAKRK